MATLTPGRSGSHLRPRSLLRVAADDLSRLARIGAVLRRNGFGRFAVGAGLSEDAGPSAEIASVTEPTDAARRFRAVLEELGPTFVKVGQILSTRPDVLPSAFIAELSELQDNAPAVPFEAIRDALEAGLGRPMDVAFASVEPTPVASASMAQTHRATLHSGEQVIIKVQRPGIAETMRADLDLMHLFARLLEATIAEMDLYAPADIVRALDDALSGELDFYHEADNLDAFAEAFEGDPEFLVPKRFPDLSSRTVLTMELVNGRKISALAPGSDEAHTYASKLVEAFYRMIFDHGVFHGDPHPGNLIVADDARLAFIDFGLVGFVSANQRERLVTLILSVLTGDVDGIARVLLRMGRPVGHVSMQEFKAEVSSIRDRYLRRNLRNIDLAAFVQECLDAAQRHRIRVATDYSVLVKAAVTLEGVVRTLAPDLDLAALIEPYQRRLVAAQYGQERVMRLLAGSALHVGSFLRDVPDQVEQVLMDVEAGRFQIRVVSDDTRALATELNRQATRLFLALSCAACIVATPLFLANEPVWLWGRVPLLTTLSALTAASLAFWGLAWHVVGGRARDFRLRLGPVMRLLRRPR
ncbi:MAG: AarF/ABC1/UbiB kinase family protein [Myxococcales bacterium]|nr:AarF/ABC1/UbiB kinase family protein [Myxococcales bacterium]